jgi:hypothetical protein
MPIKIPPNKIQNLQQIEAVVAGPDEANRLLIIDGQFNSVISAVSQTDDALRKEIFSVLVGPVFTRKQFVNATATASIVNTSLEVTVSPFAVNWQITDADADWDDESGQVELRIEATVEISGGQNNKIAIYGFAFHVTILAAVPAA